MQRESTSPEFENARGNQAAQLDLLYESVGLAFEADAIVNLVSRELWRASEAETNISDDVTVCARALEGVSRLMMMSIEIVDTFHTEAVRAARPKGWLK